MLKQRIMLIEDDPDATILLKILLKYENYEVVSAKISDEDDLIRQIKRLKCDSLFIDVNLSNIDGIKLLGRIRRELYGYNPLIIMTSALDLASRCLKAGADCFLQKPYDPNDLFSALSRADLVSR